MKQSKHFEIRYTQNFLQDQTLVDQLVDRANIEPGSTVLEIGPGDGIITRSLAKRVTDGRVIAIELDTKLAAKLRRDFEETAQVQIIQQDIQTYSFKDLPRDYVVFSNVPFNITSVLLETLFDPGHGPQSAHLILQQDTLMDTSRPGIITETFKSMLVKPYYQVNRTHSFSKSDFYPQPSVDTALFHFERRNTPLIQHSEYQLYKDFLAFVSKDRVGEGVWKKVFSKRQLETLTQQSDLVTGRGLKSQSIDAIVAAFQVFASLDESKRQIIGDLMTNLRGEQKRREQINQAGGHHRSNKSRRYKGKK